MKTGKDRPAQQPPKPRCVHRMLEGQCAICSDLAPRRGPAEVSPAAARPATASTTTATAPTTKAGPPPLPMAERIRSAARRAEERRGTTTATASTTTATASTTTATAPPSAKPATAAKAAQVEGLAPISAVLHTTGEDEADRPLCERCRIRPSTVPGPRSTIHAPPVATKGEAEAEVAAEVECSKFCTTCRGNATQKAKDRIAAKEGVDKKTRRPRNPRWSEVAAVLAEPYKPMASRPPRRGVVSSAPALAAAGGLSVVEHPDRDPDARAAARKAEWSGPADPAPKASRDTSTPAPSDSSDLVAATRQLEQGATVAVLHAKGEDTRVLCRSVGRSKIAPANEVTCPDCLALLKVDAGHGQVMTVELEAGALAATKVRIHDFKPGTRFLDSNADLWVRTANGIEVRLEAGDVVEVTDLDRVEREFGPFQLHDMTDEQEDRKLEAFLAGAASKHEPVRLRRVIVESPYKSGDVRMNEAYARRAMADCLRRGEAPFASHLLYTQPGVLRDEVDEERSLGIEAGLVWGAGADATVVYEDLGISGGMRMGIDRAKAEGRPVEMRRLPPAEFAAANVDAEMAREASFGRMLNEAREIIDSAGGLEVVPLMVAIRQLVADRAEAKRLTVELGKVTADLAMSKGRLGTAEARLREVEAFGFGVRHDPDADPHGKTWVAFVDGVTEAPGEVPTEAAKELRARLVREWTSTEHTAARIRELEEKLRMTDEDVRKQDAALEAFERPPVSTSGFDFQNVVTFLLASGIYGRTWPEMRKAILEEKLRDIALSTGFV